MISGIIEDRGTITVTCPDIQLFHSNRYKSIFVQLNRSRQHK